MSGNDGNASSFEIRNAMNWTVMLAVTLGLLVVGRDVLMPLAVAVLLWSLLNAFSDFIQRFGLGGYHAPRWLATTLAVLVLVLANYVVFKIIFSQTDALQEAAPVYQENFSRLAGEVAAWLDIEQLPATAQVLDQLDVASIFAWIGGSVGAAVADIVLVAIYLGFLLAEQGNLPAKFARLQPDKARAAKTRHLAVHISRNVQRYMWVKTIISLLTAAVAYGILKLMGLDFAVVWALVIFFLNYIPNIGSVIGVIFPALLALVQFDTITPFIFVVLGLGSAQFIIGNIIEPAFMGRSLNMSSFMIIISLTFWGIIWGVPGMILSVPIMVTLAIICSHVPALRWIAIFLSSDGQLFEVQDKSA